MPSQDFKRSDRIADLIKVEISQVLSQEVRDPRVQGITVLNVLLTSDMKKADIFISQSNSFNEMDSEEVKKGLEKAKGFICLLYTSPSPRDQRGSRMPSSA